MASSLQKSGEWRQKLFGCIATSIILVWLTTLQEPQCALLVLLTTLLHGMAYAFLRVSGVLQPKRGLLSYADEAEWRSRILGNINASLLIVGSILCFLEWPFSPAEEGWTGPGRIWSHPVTFASLFVGFLQWDLCWLIWHRKEHNDPSAMVHHALFIAITHFVLWGFYFKRPFAWLSFTELSTPFLNARWFLAASGRKDGMPYFLSSLFFALAFLATRVVGYTLGLVDMWRNMYVWRSSDHWFTGLHGVVIGLHLGYILNLFWSIKVIGAMRRALKRKSE